LQHALDELNRRGDEWRDGKVSGKQ
jgi:hypothetical protein